MDGIFLFLALIVNPNFLNSPFKKEMADAGGQRINKLIINVSLILEKLPKN